MEKQKKQQRKKYISWAVLAGIVVLLAVMPLLAGSHEEAGGPRASILTAAAEKKDIAIQLVGGGTLAGETPLEITVPAAVKLTQYLAGNGDTVARGDPIALVDRVSVMHAISQVQDALDQLAEQIEAASGEEAADRVTAQAAGTVKAVYAREGESVQDVMLRHGCLAVLSLDGLMGVEIESSISLAPGDKVRVTLADKETQGRVVSNPDGTLAVTVEDDGYAIGEAATVCTSDGQPIGTGALYVCSPWNAVAYSGTVEDIRIKEGDSVTPGRTLMTLADPGPSGEFQQLVSRRREYESLMLELFQLHQTGTLSAPCDGIVTGVDKNGAYMLRSSGEWQVSLLANAPNGDDETAYTNFVGQVVAAGIDGYVMRMNFQPFPVDDYTDLSGVPLDPALMSEEVIYEGLAPVFDRSDDGWVQADTASVAPGDILLFAADSEGRFLWIVRVYQAPSPEVPETQPTEPELPVDITLPADTLLPGTQFPQAGGDLSGLFGGTAEPEDDLYSTETVTVASITSQEEMTVQITLDQQDITRISLGQEADVTVDALPGEHFPATVTHIATSGENQGGSSKFTVELTLTRSGKMLPGMRASAVLPLSTATQVLAVPAAALVEDGSRTLLYTGYDQETGELTAPIPVTTGVSDGEWVQVLSGIPEGTTFYYTYYDTLEISDVPEQGFNFSFGR